MLRLILAANVKHKPQDTPSSSRYKNFASVKIARLAIDKSLQKQGYGEELLIWCIIFSILTY
jgi:hypothetical protein